MLTHARTAHLNMCEAYEELSKRPAKRQKLGGKQTSLRKLWDQRGGSIHSLSNEKLNALERNVGLFICKSLHSFRTVEQD